jgi:hypothetical protein
VAVAGVPEVIILLQIFQKDKVIKLIIPVVINTRCDIVHLLPSNIHDINLHRITRGSSGIEDSGKKLGSKTPRLKG